MPDLWKKSLREIQNRFRTAGEKYPGLRCALELRAPGDDSTLVEMKKRIHVGDFRFSLGLWSLWWRRADDPKAIWNLVFYFVPQRYVGTERPLPNKERLLGNEAQAKFVEQATAAAHIIKAGEAWKMLPEAVREKWASSEAEKSENEPNLWVATMFHLAWKCVDGTLLRADRLTLEAVPEGETWSEPPALVPAEESSNAFVSFLPIDPFSASVAAIGLLLDSASPVGFLAGRASVRELAERYSLPYDATRARLDRWRHNNAEGWMEVSATERGSRDPKYLYEVAAVQSVIKDLQRKHQKKRPSNVH